MNVSQGFYSTRKPLEPITAIDVLYADLNVKALQNNADYENGIAIKRTVFHVTNSKGFVVNVILSKDNNIIVRGHAITSNYYDSLQKAIERVTD